MTVRPDPLREVTRALDLLLLAVIVVVAAVWASGCSASAVRAQAVTAATTSTAANTALDVFFGVEGNGAVDSLYARAQQRVALVACGFDPDDATTVRQCPKDAVDDAAAAVTKIREQWSAVMHVWSLARVAHSAWRIQLERCQRELRGTDAGTECTARLDELAATVVRHITVVRCSLRGLGVTDPFPGTVTCPGAPSSGERDAGDHE